MHLPYYKMIQVKAITKNLAFLKKTPFYLKEKSNLKIQEEKKLNKQRI